MKNILHTNIFPFSLSSFRYAPAPPFERNVKDTRTERDEDGGDRRRRQGGGDKRTDRHER